MTMEAVRQRRALLSRRSETAKKEILGPTRLPTLEGLTGFPGIYLPPGVLCRDQAKCVQEQRVGVG